MLPRIVRFLQKPWREKYRSFYSRWIRLFTGVPLPVRLPFGAWFLARSDYMSAAVVYGEFEPAERAFVGRFLRPGMTVLDIGAHHGFYTLFFSKLVGSTGRVFAFEPSPRERRALHLNVGLNRCRNVVIQGFALDNKEGQSYLYLVNHYETGCNSLQPPVMAESTSIVPVHVISLDQWRADHLAGSVDFIKLDVEGAELSVLQGAEKLLGHRQRPVILAEVQDIRTQPWGYRAREIISFLTERGYKWFSISADGSLAPLPILAETFDGNFVACPEESESIIGYEEERRTSSDV